MKRPENTIIIKTEAFADRIIRMCRYLTDEDKGEKDAIRQIYRSGKSVGANTAESQYAQSRADFLTKMTIALKEANETKFWLGRLHSEDALNDKEYNSINDDCVEIIKLLTSITKTIKTK
jgi:four helix bundle protein